MIAVFHGNDDFSANEALNEIRAGLDTDGMLADNTARVDGAGAKPDELLAVCQTLPFMGAHRLVVVHGLLRRFQVEQGRRRGKPKKDEPKLGRWQPFADGLQALPDTTTLVFMEQDLDGGNLLLKALPPGSRVEEFKERRQGELAQWIIERAQHHGVAIEARAIAALATLVGPRLWTLDSEIRKLGTYAGGAAVTEADVKTLVPLAREPNVFAMVDATVEGRQRDALDMLQRLLADGEAPQYLLVMITRQYRLLIQVKELLAKRLRAPDIASSMRERPFVVQRLINQAPAHTMSSLRRAYRLILDADLSIKLGRFDDEAALQLLVVELASLARAQPAHAS
jgi:DNA polymerase-3 subunit delta